jgi:hypothetical protein
VFVEQLPECIQVLSGLVGFELFQIALSKLRPFVRIMTKPFAQFGRRGKSFQPVGNVDIFLGDTPGPDAIHQYAGAV